MLENHPNVCLVMITLDFYQFSTFEIKMSHSIHMLSIQIDALAEALKSDK